MTGMIGQISVPLQSLSLDPMNVRKGKQPIDMALVASLKARGQIEPLIVRKDREGYFVTNGGKRLAAFNWLREQQEQAKGETVTAIFPVSVVVRDDDDTQAKDVSLITSVMRAPLHPVEQYEAFADLVHRGRTPADIAASYGISEADVRRALRLGDGLADAVKDAWRAGKIDASAARAFTLASDQAEQVKALTKLAKEYPGNQRIEAHAVQRKLNLANDTGRALEFVGIEAYEAAGGKVVRDLFGDQHQVSDRKLLNKLLSQKLEALCEQLKADGWAWAQVPTQENVHSFGSLKPPIHQDSKAVTQLRREYHASNDAAERAEIDRKIEAQVILDDAARFDARERAESGVLVQWTYHGLRLWHGRLTPQERRKAERKKAERKPKTEGATEDQHDAQISNKLLGELTAQLTRACTAQASQAPDAALDLVLAALIYNGSAYDRGVMIRADGLVNEPRENVPFHDALARVAGLSQQRKLSWLANYVGRSFNLHCADRNAFESNAKTREAIMAALGNGLVDAIRGEFDPMLYFTSVSKEIIHSAVLEVLGDDAAASVAKMKKDEAAKFAASELTLRGWLPEELRPPNYKLTTRQPSAKKASAKKSKHKRKGK